MIQKFVRIQSFISSIGVLASGLLAVGIFASSPAHADEYWRRSPNETSPGYTKIEATDFGELILMIGRISRGLENADPEDRRQARRFVEAVDTIIAAESRVLHTSPTLEGKDETTEIVIHGALRQDHEALTCESETRVIHRLKVSCNGGCIEKSFSVRVSFKDFQDSSLCARRVN